jgi:hypothetical protein
MSPRVIRRFDAQDLGVELIADFSPTPCRTFTIMTGAAASLASWQKPGRLFFLASAPMAWEGRAVEHRCLGRLGWATVALIACFVLRN